MAGVLGLGNFGGPSHCSGQAMRTFSVTRPTGAERFLHVTLDFSGGSVLLTPASTGQLYGMRVRYDPARYEPVQQYDARTGILRLGLESVPPCLLCVFARQSDFDRQVEQDRHIGLQTGGGEGYHRRQRLHIKTPARALVHQRRVGKPVAHHHLAAGQRRLNDLLDKLGADGRTLASATAAQNAVAAVRGLVRGTLSVGAEPCLGSIDLPAELGTFRAANP